MVITLSGSVETFDLTAFKAALLNYFGPTVASLTLSMSSGSVVVDATVVYTTYADAAAGLTSIIEKSASDLSSMLGEGFQVESITPTLSAGHANAPPMPPLELIPGGSGAAQGLTGDEGGGMDQEICIASLCLPLWQLIAIGGGALTLLIGCIFLVCCCAGRRRTNARASSRFLELEEGGEMWNSGPKLFLTNNSGAGKSGGGRARVSDAKPAEHYLSKPSNPASWQRFDDMSLATPRSAKLGGSPSGKLQSSGSGKRNFPADLQRTPSGRCFPPTSAHSTGWQAQRGGASTPGVGDEIGTSALLSAGKRTKEHSRGNLMSHKI
jgi:hypothetical protein